MPGVFVLTYPVLVMTVRGAANALLFAAAAISLGALAARWMKNRAALSAPDRIGTGYCIAMACPLLAIVLSETWHGRVVANTLDSPTRFLIVVPVFLLLRSGMRRALRWSDLSFAIGAVGTGAIMVLRPHDWGGGRSASSFLNPIHFGDIALILGVLSALSIDWWKKDGPAVRGLKVFGALAGIAASLQTQSRGGWIALPVISALLLYVGLHGKSWRLKLAATALVTIVVIAPYWLSPVVHERFNMVAKDITDYLHGHRDTSVGVRFQLWQAAFQLLKEHPLLGLGAAGYKQSMAGLAAQNMLTPVAAQLGMGETHNQLLAYAADYGVIGALALMVIYVAPCVLFWKYLWSPDRVARRAALMGLAFVVGFFVFGLTVETFDLKMTAAFYATTTAILAAIAATPTPSNMHAPA